MANVIHFRKRLGEDMSPQDVSGTEYQQFALHALQKSIEERLSEHVKRQSALRRRLMWRAGVAASGVAKTHHFQGFPRILFHADQLRSLTSERFSERALKVEPHSLEFYPVEKQNMAHGSRNTKLEAHP